MLIDKNLNDKNKKYMLADSIYYVNEVKSLLSNEEYEYIINPNRKNIKYKIQRNRKIDTKTNKNLCKKNTYRTY